MIVKVRLSSVCCLKLWYIKAVGTVKLPIESLQGRAAQLSKVVSLWVAFPIYVWLCSCRACLRFVLGALWLSDVLKTVLLTLEVELSAIANTFDCMDFSTHPIESCYFSAEPVIHWS